MARNVRDPQARDRLVEAARVTIAELGIRGATVRAIAAAGGVSTGYVMHYFEDKQQLAAAVLDANNVRAGARVQAASERKRGLAGLTAAVEALLPLDAERRLEWQVWVAFWNDPAGYEQAPDALTGARRALGSIFLRPLSEAVADGDLPDGLDLGYESERLITLAAGLGLTAGVGSPAAVGRLARRMLNDHLRSLAAGATGAVRAS
jgi:AcrR family transcriptional regulator